MRVSNRAVCSIVLAVVGAALFVIGCGNPDEQPVPGHDKPGVNAHKPPPQNAKVVERQPAVTPSDFKATFKVVSAVFNARCMPCHSAQVHKGGIDLSSYEAVKADKVDGVDFTDPSQKGIDAIYGDKPKMPKVGLPLALDDISAIAGWIHQGAKND